jgi:hypothetical protein
MNQIMIQSSKRTKSLNFYIPVFPLSAALQLPPLQQLTHAGLCVNDRLQNAINTGSTQRTYVKSDGIFSKRQTKRNALFAFILTLVLICYICSFFSERAQKRRMIYITNTHIRVLFAFY